MGPGHKERLLSNSSTVFFNQWTLWREKVENCTLILTPGPALMISHFTCLYFPHLKNKKKSQFFLYLRKVEEKVSQKKNHSISNIYMHKQHMHQNILPLFLLFRLVAMHTTISMVQAAWLQICNNKVDILPSNASYCQDSGDSKYLLFKAGSWKHLYLSFPPVDPHKINSDCEWNCPHFRKSST